jgi:FKBP-type peptidyl-prolyl cis-trans isomerase
VLLPPPSGLQYEVLTQGNRAKPTVANTVVCHYKGTLLDGTEVIILMLRNSPAEFCPVTWCYQRMDEALQLMPVGSKYKLI